MNLHPLLLPAAILAVLAGALASQLVLAVRSRRRLDRRTVEAPNSHHDPPAVRNIQTRERWADIRLDRVHEVNRGEVERLLLKLNTLGVDALLPRERQFLDVMLEISAAHG
jgi:hypothetical protein